MEKGLLLSIYLDEADKWHHQPLFEVILERAKQEGLAGATLWKGLAGFGTHHRIHAAHLLDLSADLPVLIQIVDRPAAIEAFLPILEALLPEGLITLSEVRIKKRA